MKVINCSFDNNGYSGIRLAFSNNNYISGNKNYNNADLYNSSFEKKTKDQFLFEEIRNISVDYKKYRFFSLFK